MISLLIAAIALLPFAIDAAPEKKPKPLCPADTVIIRLHYHEDNLFPYVIADTLRGDE